MLGTDDYLWSKKQLPDDRELVIDNFAGGGGASQGIEQALRLPVDIAINHDQDAVEMHIANHPDTLHYCENIWQINPLEVTQGKPVGLAWFSPDCTHFSKARGGKPVKKQIRGLAWVVIKWAKLVKPRVIVLENVEEFKTWGPLDSNNQPIKAKVGQTFNGWLRQLKTLGYQVEHRELVAADYGTPTSRKRFFLIARCDGEKIVWPRKTHGPDKKKPYRAAAECIDWSIPCPSIFERKRPLVDNTLRRIARGIQKYVIEAKEPFIIGIDNQSNGASSVWSAEQPLRTITKENRFALVSPFVSKYYGGVVGSGIQKPLSTVTAIDHNALVMPFLSKYHGLKDKESRCQKVDEPIKTLDTQNRFALVSAFLTKFYNTNIGSDLRLPMPTITGQGQHIGQVQAFLIKYYKTNIGHSLNDPMHTITSKDRLGLVTVAGVNYQIVDIGLRMLHPRELALAQGFPNAYILTGTKTNQVAKIGNSVCPPMARAIVAANVKIRKIEKVKVG